jgi:hypothetical protein
MRPTAALAILAPLMALGLDGRALLTQRSPATNGATSLRRGVVGGRVMGTPGTLPIPGATVELVGARDTTPVARVVTDASPDVDVGTITLTAVTVELQGVRSTAQRRDVALAPDRKALADTGAIAPLRSDPVVVAVGDIANCASVGDEATASIVARTAATVLVLGDNVYPKGSRAQYAACYGPSWGRFKARTRPTPGNHEYGTPDARGYFGYFGTVAGAPGRGWYSFDLGAWHVVVLNSGNCAAIRCDARSAQVRWLRADLEAHPRACTLAIWHHPRFNSGGRHGNTPSVGPFWDVLYAHGADVILNGHEHVYERFAPQTPDGVPSAAHGIRQFTVGTGGESHHWFRAVPQPNSEVRESDTYGVLELTLHARGYTWRFLPVAGSRFADAGSGTCH